MQRMQVLYFTIQRFLSSMIIPSHSCNLKRRMELSKLLLDFNGTLLLSKSTNPGFSPRDACNYLLVRHYEGRLAFRFDWNVRGGLVQMLKKNTIIMTQFF
ncbi:hypothetical protein M758_1G144900 [Ceratodon purpureus]|nr:hypothetical protein M758_1G144900 [Ceratodon purpureus]